MNTLALELTTLALETKALKMCVRTSVTHYQRLPNRVYVKMIIYGYLPRNGRYHVAGVQEVSRCRTAPLAALNWSCKAK